MKNSFLSKIDVEKIGFKTIGNFVSISRNASFYSSEKISIGSNVRIDDFCILSGNITIGDNVHISAGTFLFGGDSEIVIGNHVSVSSRCAIYAITDDFRGKFLVGSVEPNLHRNVIRKKVILEDYVVVGTGSTILPGVTISQGVAIGAMSLVKESLEPWFIYAGTPCSKIKKREKISIGELNEN